MLRGLEIRDMLIIDRLDLAFQPGLNVLTGETGAGKSILLDSLGFVLGWRGRADLVRSGADQAEVVAEFTLPNDHPGLAILQDAGLPIEDGDLVLRRSNTRDGRKTAWINDRRVSTEILRRLSETLVELHGQHDDRGLLDPKGHLALLDAFAGHDGQQVRLAWTAVQKIKKTRDQAVARVQDIKSEEEFLRHAVAELDALDPQPGEEAALDARRRMMQGAEKSRQDIAKAAEALGLQGAEGLLGDASRWMQTPSADLGALVDTALEALERALDELDQAQSGVAACLDALNFNPSELEEAEDRLFAIRGLARKHNVQPDALSELADDLRGRLQVLDGGADEVDTLDRDLSAAQKQFDDAALALRAARQAAAARLDAAMGAELAPLKMDRAVFETVLDDAPAGSGGIDSAVFKVATNPGAPAGPLNKIASGGELSRFLLALKVCLSQAGQGGKTLIFDEIDRGVGGATADAVGRRLASLAAGAQVMVVTHSPQVAALGGHHWRVEKAQSAQQTLTTVVPLSRADRVDEIARMLSGDTITDAAREAAIALIPEETAT